MSVLYINTPQVPARIDEINFNGRVIPVRGAGVKRITFTVDVNRVPNLIVEYVALNGGEETALLLQAVTGRQ